MISVYLVRELYATKGRLGTSRFHPSSQGPWTWVCVGQIFGTWVVVILRLSPCSNLALSLHARDCTCIRVRAQHDTLLRDCADAQLSHNAPTGQSQQPSPQPDKAPTGQLQGRRQVRSALWHLIL